MSSICQDLKPCTRNQRRNLPANSGRPREIVRPGSDQFVSLASATRRIPQGEPWQPLLQVGSGRASDLRSDRVHHRPAHPSWMPYRHERPTRHWPRQPALTAEAPQLLPV